MSQKPSYFRIGLFVVVALAILTGGLIAFGAGQMFARGFTSRHMSTAPSRLDVGIASQVPRRAMGRVSAINFTFNEYGRQPGGSFQLCFYSDGDRP